MKANREYGVSRLARLAGVSVRTLHHYHAIGLLVPAHQGANGYRTYGQAERLRLQEILFLKAFGFGLDAIGRMLDAPGGTLARLQEQRAVLQAEQARRGALLAMLDAAIADMSTGAFTMTDDLYQPPPAALQAEYEGWLEERLGAGAGARIAEGKAAIAGAPGGPAALMEAMRQAESGLVAAFAAGRAAGEASAAFEAHRAVIGRFWGRDCTPGAYAGLADIYESHPDFISRFERLAPGFARWLIAGMRGHATSPG